MTSDDLTLTQKEAVCEKSLMTMSEINHHTYMQKNLLISGPEILAMSKLTEEY